MYRIILIRVEHFLQGSVTLPDAKLVAHTLEFLRIDIADTGGCHLRQAEVARVCRSRGRPPRYGFLQLPFQCISTSQLPIPSR